MSRYAASTLGFIVALLCVPLAAAAQDTAMSDSDYTAKVAAAAPPAVVKGATIVQMQKDGTMRTLQRPGRTASRACLPTHTTRCVWTPTRCYGRKR